MEYCKEINIDIKNQDIDFNGKLKLNSLFGYYQIAASEHAEELHFGYSDLEKLNLIWILSSINVEILDFPDWKEKMVLKTITKGLTGIFAVRNYELLNQKNQIIINAVSYWLLVDRKSFRIFRPNSNSVLDKNIFFENPDLKHPEKILLSENKLLADFYKFRYSDIDINMHVNNTQYVRLITDCLGKDFYTENKIVEFKINFIRETIYNDEIEIYKEEPELGEIKFEGINKTNMAQVFTSSVKYLKK